MSFHENQALCFVGNSQFAFIDNYAGVCDSPYNGNNFAEEW